MKNKKFLISLLTICGFALMAMGQDSIFTTEPDPSELFIQANSHFESGEFSLAIKEYNHLVENGFGNSGVHYNLGNSYYRQKNFPMAILHYEKALDQNPDYEAAQRNLALVNSNNIDVFEVLPPSIFDTLSHLFFGVLSPNLWSLIALVLGLAATLLLFQFYRSGRANSASFSGAMIAIVISISSLFMAWKSDVVQADQIFAIVLAPNVYVKTEPTTTATDALILHEGTKVLIQRTYNDWLEVRLVDGRTGWVPSGTTGEI